MVRLGCLFVLWYVCMILFSVLLWFVVLSSSRCCIGVFVLCSIVIWLDIVWLCWFMLIVLISMMCLLCSLDSVSVRLFVFFIVCIGMLRILLKMCSCLWLLIW